MTNKLFVGGLAYTVTDTLLAQHFSQMGSVVSSKVVMDRDTGRSRGFGFVEMSSPQEAKTAMDKLNNSPIDNRPIFVKEAHPQVDR